jgi:hypothetical protein
MKKGKMGNGRVEELKNKEGWDCEGGGKMHEGAHKFAEDDCPLTLKPQQKAGGFGKRRIKKWGNYGGKWLHPNGQNSTNYGRTENFCLEFGMERTTTPHKLAVHK